MKLRSNLICGAASFGVFLASANTIASAQENETEKVQQLLVQQETASLDSYKTAWQFAKENFYDKTYNGQNWSRWEHKYDSQIRDFDDANLAISTMIASLGDKDSYFFAAHCFDDEKNQIVEQYCRVGMHIGLTETGKLEVRAPVPIATACEVMRKRLEWLKHFPK